MKVTIDTQQRIKASGIFLLEFYKVLMGTCLIAFVPQQCDDHVCSIMENIHSDDPLKIAANCLNALTLLSILAFYRVELMRENWCIHYLDIDHEKPLTYLDTEIEQYPKYKTEMKILNEEYLLFTYITIAMLCVNFVVSGVSIGFDYAGVNTATAFISFLILVVSKITHAYTIGMKSVHEEHALSAYMTTAETYNTIDVECRNDAIKVEEVETSEPVEPVEAIEAIETVETNEVRNRTVDEINKVNDTDDVVLNIAVSGETHL